MAHELARLRVERLVEQVAAQAELGPSPHALPAVVEVVVEEQQRALPRRHARDRIAVAAQEERMSALERLPVFALEALAFPVEV